MGKHAAASKGAPKQSRAAKIPKVQAQLNFPPKDVVDLEVVVDDDDTRARPSASHDDDNTSLSLNVGMGNETPPNAQPDNGALGLTPADVESLAVPASWAAGSRDGGATQSWMDQLESNASHQTPADLENFINAELAANTSELQPSAIGRDDAGADLAGEPNLTDKEQMLKQAGLGRTSTTKNIFSSIMMHMFL